jgi:hypothetical protein
MTTGNEVGGIGRQSQTLDIGRDVCCELIIALAALQIIRSNFKEELIDEVLALIIALIEGLLIETCGAYRGTIDSQKRQGHCHGKDQERSMKSEHTVFSLWVTHVFKSLTCNVPGPRASQHPKVAIKTRFPTGIFRRSVLMCSCP